MLVQWSQKKQGTAFRYLIDFQGETQPRHGGPKGPLSSRAFALLQGLLELARRLVVQGLDETFQVLARVRPGLLSRDGEL